MARGQAIGSAGELIVQARLLVRGWTTGNVNAGGMMNAPAVDLVALKGASSPIQFLTPMTLGNMRANGVRTLPVRCGGRGCNCQ